MSTERSPIIAAPERVSTSEVGTFGSLLRQARLGKGWGQRELARRAGLDASYINRLEAGRRRPARDAGLALAEALGIRGAALDRWLAAAGHASLTFLAEVGGAVQTGGGLGSPLGESGAAVEAGRDTLVRLEKIGLHESAIRRLVQAMDAAEPDVREQTADALRAALAQLAQRLESLV